MQNDNHLLLAIGANEVWQIDIFILCQGHETADIKIGFSYPVGCGIHWGLIAAGADLNTRTWGLSDFGSTDYLHPENDEISLAISLANITGYRFSLIVINGGNAGNLNLQWAQKTKTVADTTVLENSCLIGNQLA
ncbi:unnamed protein product [marine sediment metagenome]|uniref:Uncharacterized protein n=1 Tax=marine sediment metagenome TaxID=412755 RepID=X1EL49_9ZZZZ